MLSAVQCRLCREKYVISIQFSCENVFCPCSNELAVEFQVGLGGLSWKGTPCGCCACDVLLKAAVMLLGSSSKRGVEAAACSLREGVLL